jgi:peptide/nickel transport system permease protein
MSLLSYTVRRLVLALPTVLGVTVLVFFMIHMVPGDPAAAFLGPRATPALVARLHHAWGLDRPLPEQYLLFMGRLLHGNLGQSFFYHLPATTLIASRIGPTLLLLLFATVFTLVITIPLAALAAARRERLADHLIRGLPVVALGLPPFWVGIMLVLFFALKVPVFPVGGYGSGLAGHLRSLVLPGLTIALSLSPMTIRSLRSSMVDVLDADYIVTARAKGVRGTRMMARHVLRNAVIPMITVLSVNIGWLVGGTVVVEQVFALPGLGGLMLNAISNRDYALVQAITLVFAVLVILVYLIADLSYALIDPRVRYR